MNININPISNLRYTTSKINNTNKPQEPANVEVSPNYKHYSHINFQAKTVKFKKPVLENPEVQKLSDKISYFLEKMPQNFNIRKPIEIKFGRDVIGFTIDKTEENKTKILIKRMQYTDKLENWDSSKGYTEILSMILNKDGQMIEGSYLQPCSYHSLYNYDSGTLFERSSKNIRRLKIGGTVFAPTAGDNNTWKAINKDERLILGNSLPLFPEDYRLREFYYELTKLDTAL